MEAMRVVRDKPAHRVLAGFLSGGRWRRVGLLRGWRRLRECARADQCAQGERGRKYGSHVFPLPGSNGDDTDSVLETSAEHPELPALLCEQVIERRSLSRSAFICWRTAMPCRSSASPSVSASFFFMKPPRTRLRSTLSVEVVPRENLGELNSRL